MTRDEMVADIAWLRAKIAEVEKQPMEFGGLYTPSELEEFYKELRSARRKLNEHDSREKLKGQATTR